MVGDQASGIGGLRGREHGAGWPLFDQMTALEDGDAIGEARSERQIMGDEKQRHAVFTDEFVEQRYDFGLHHHVERARCLVGDQEGGAGGYGRGNCDALALAAGKLVGIGSQRLFRMGNADAVQQVQCMCERFLPANAEMSARAFGNLLADGDDRI